MKRSPMKRKKGIRKSKATSSEVAAYRAKKAEVAERDDHRCNRCSSSQSLECAHVVTLGAGRRRMDNDSPLNAIANMVMLCHSCHRKQTVGEWRWVSIGIHAECENGHAFEPEMIRDLECVHCDKPFGIKGPSN